MATADLPRSMNEANERDPYNNNCYGTLVDRPYLEVTAPSDRRVDTVGRFGGECLIHLHAVTDGAGDQQGNRILDLAIQAVDFQHPTLTGHSMLGLAWDDSVRYTETVNSIKVHHHVASVRAWAEQSSS